MEILKKNDGIMTTKKKAVPIGRNGLSGWTLNGRLSKHKHSIEVNVDEIEVYQI